MAARMCSRVAAVSSRKRDVRGLEAESGAQQIADRLHVVDAAFETMDPLAPEAMTVPGRPNRS